MSTLPTTNPRCEHCGPGAAGDRPRPRRRWGRRLFLGLLAGLGAVLIVVLGSMSWTLTLGGTASGARLQRIEASPNFRDGQFRNAGPGLVQPVGDQGKTMREYFRGDPSRRPPHPLPAVPRAAILDALARSPASGLRVTWLGHSTLLLEIDGRRFLTDPMFSLRASPSSLVGARRFQPPALAIDDLPALNGVILSHDHYDHLDLPSVRALDRRGVTFYVPLGVGAHLERWGVPAERIVEHDWWERSKVGEVELVSVPAHHFSGRRGVDFNRTLWTSWVIAGPGHRVFFSGDSGLASVQGVIGERFGPFDIAFMDVGAWNETWADIHFGPRGALDAVPMLRARRFMPIHWGTFELALHAWDEPVETVLAEAGRRKIDLLIPKLGEPVEPAEPRELDPWWRR